MSKRDGACWRHPAHRAAGVCADCLTERLVALSPAAEAAAAAGFVPHRASYGDRSSAFGFVALESRRNLAAGSRAGAVDGAGCQRQLVSPLLSDAYLRRSKSWSHWEGNSNITGGGGGGAASSAARNGSLHGFPGRKSDAVLDDWTRQRFFSIFAKDQSQQKRKESSSSACHSNNRGTPQHFHGGALKTGASGGGTGGGNRWLSSSKVDFRGDGLINATGTSFLENGGTSFIDKGSSSSARKTSSSRKSSAWWAALLATFRRNKTRPDGDASKKKSSGGGGGSALAGYFNRARKEEAKYMNLGKGRPPQHSPSFVNWKQHQHHKQADCHTKSNNNNSNNNPSWISSPLRIFKHGNASSDHSKTMKQDASIVNPATCSSSCHQTSDQQQKQQHDQHHQQQQNGGERRSSSEERSSWSIPSSAELKKLQAATPAYTAYYRDYGAWSLSSSPVPHGRNSGGRGKQPWENRDVAHSASSPYHRVGSSTWNFYLTPLRPAKSKAASSTACAATGSSTSTTTTITTAASKQHNRRQQHGSRSGSSGYRW